ncbi:MAG: bi-domain-containing oxidoreductase [Candidatus Bathyarchaeaceae archaeon]
MKQVFVRSNEVIVEDVPLPLCGDEEVLVANAYSVISVGTELSAVIRGKRSLVMSVLKDSALREKALAYLRKRGIKESLTVARERGEALVPLGYSSAGIVIGVGENVIDLNVGNRVACAGGGKANHAEVVSVPRNLVAKIPQGVSFEEAALTTLGAISMHGIRRAEVRFGETVVIFGVGLLGQLAVQIAKAAGCKVAAVDTDSPRVEFAKRMGADVGLVAGKDDLEKEVLYHTGGVGADAVIIYAATSSSEPVNQAMRMCRKKGRIVVVGDVGMELKRSPFYEKELDFLISRSYGPGRYDPSYEEKGIDYPIEYVRWTENRNMQAFLDLLGNRKIDVKPFIDEVFPIEEAKTAYDMLISGEKRPFTVLLKYDPSRYVSVKGEVVSVKRAVEISPKIVEGKINTAVIGAGGFAKDVLLPLMSKIPDYNLRAIVSATGINAKQVAKKYNAEYCTTDHREVLEDENVDLVVITTPHNLHYPMIIDAAKAGKAIYAEKPMCLTEGELDEIVKVISKTKVPLIVGFNRRYAPLAIKAKELLRSKHRPYLINYRVNAGFIPKTSWVQNPEVGGGRIIGECCHFLDLFNFFIESEVESISAVSIPVNNATVVANDNLVVAVKWTDGSLTALLYTALGHGDLPKERIEIYANGSSMVIDDFKNMELYGFREKNVRLKRQDKGHYQQLLEISRFLKGEKANVISFQECEKAMRMTFEAEKLIKETGKDWAHRSSHKETV